MLALSGNHLIEIYSNTWNHLIYLPSLDLSKMRIQRINEFSFSGLNEVKVVNLSYNHLTGISLRSFVGMPNLFILDIRGNDISYVEPDSFVTVGKSLLTNQLVVCCYCNQV